MVRRWVAALGLVSGVAAGQTSGSLSVSMNYPPNSVVSAMFGALPKDVALIEVTACNDTPAALALSNGRLVQSLRKIGIQALRGMRPFRRWGRRRAGNGEACCCGIPRMQ
jgi:hypothetical protein